MGKAIVQKASIAKRLSKAMATQESNIAGMKILGRLAPMKRESTKLAAKVVILLPRVVGSTPVILQRRVTATETFPAVKRNTKTKQSREPQYGKHEKAR